MKEYDIISPAVLDDLIGEIGAINGDTGAVELSVSFQFQLEWERTFLQMWRSLTPVEQNSIVPIQPPYTEQSVAEFLSVLTKVRKSRTFLSRTMSWFSTAKRQALPLRAIELFDRHSVVKDFNGLLQLSKMVEVPEQQYSIAKYPVTQDLWAFVMGNNPSCFQGSRRPVEMVTWFDCIEFCNKLSDLERLQKAYIITGTDIECDFERTGYRLPTDWEWYFAAKANQEFRYSGSDNPDDVAWYYRWANNIHHTHPVGQKKANAFGLYDMSGNVSEWCWDWYEEGDIGRVGIPSKQSKGPATGTDRVLRGGSWKVPVGYARISHRGQSDPRASGDQSHGFRLCRTIT